MIELRQQARFLLKMFPQFFVSSKRLLQSHGVAQPQIDCLINRAHSALAQMAQNAITALQNCVRLQEAVGIVVLVLIKRREHELDPIEVEQVGVNLKNEIRRSIARANNKLQGRKEDGGWQWKAEQATCPEPPADKMAK